MEEDTQGTSSVEIRPMSMRRTFTMRSSAARQVAVNFMPSRQLPHSTLRLRRSTSEHNALLEDIVDSDTPDAAEKQADIIVREMEQHQRLMEDNLVSEELRREALRDLPQGMTMKRNVRAKLSASVSLRSKRRPISMWKTLKYRISFAWKRARDRFRDVVFSIELWYEAIRNIEGHFGSAVGSYFYFLRWLFVLDAVLAVLAAAFVVLPQALYDAPRNTSLPTDLLHFVTGKGAFENSVIFYGHYHDGDVSTAGPLRYYMPYAYFFTMVSLYITFFAVLCYRTAYSYRRNFIETAGGLSHVFANKVFCGWDYGIVSTQAAALNAYSIYNEFKELMNEQIKKPASTSFFIRVSQYLANVAVSAVVLAVIGGVQFGLWRLLSSEKKAEPWEVLVSLAVTAVVTLCPLLFNLLVGLEFYKPRTAFYVTLARTWLLDVGTLMLILVFWARSGIKCWETSFGQETYRLVLLDYLVSLFVLPLIEFVRAFLYKLYPSVSSPQFNITYSSLTLIYNQAVVWFGALFSPLLPAAVAIKLLLLFYVKRLTALHTCQPPKKIWRAAQTQTVLNMLVTLSLFATLFGLGSLFFKSPSVECGPFRQYEAVYAVVTAGVLRLPERPHVLAVLLFLTRPGVIGFLVLCLCVSVYYMRAKALAQQSMVAILRHMLVLQAKDKDFLLTAITKVSNGEWMYSPKPVAGEGPESHTWKYLREVRRPSNSAFHFDGSRLSRSFADRPTSYIKDNRPNSSYIERPKSNEDGDTDSSFSWQGSNLNLNRSIDAERNWI